MRHPWLRRSALRLFAGGLVAGLCLAAGAHAQELKREVAPFTVWLDFDALSRVNAPRLALPVWLESVISSQPIPAAGEAPSTIYRMRLRRLGALNRELQLRVFFDDRAGAPPTVTGWTETGTRKFRSGPLGNGLGLPNSAELLIPVENIDYLDVAVAGDGSAIRGAFLTTVTRTQAITALDFKPEGIFVDPFGKPAEAKTQADDTYLFGRVKAALLAEAVKLPAEAPLGIEFQLAEQPLLAVVTFEVLNANVSAPPQVAVNGRALGAANLHLPDLADPAFRGTVVPKEAEERFHYTGWLRAEKILPASALATGLNQLTLAAAPGGETVAVRAVEVQLKYSWEALNGSATP